MTVELLLEQFYTDVRTVERLSENTAKTYTEYRKAGVIYCDSISGEHAEFDEKTGKRLR